MKYSRFIIVLILILPALCTESQEHLEIPFHSSIQLGYGIQIPGGNLADRFGLNFHLNTSLNWHLSRNWTITGSASFLFGSNVKEDVLAPFRTGDGGIIGSDLSFAQVFLRERGSIFGLLAGKAFFINNQFAIWSQFGIHRLQHRIRFQDDSQSILFLDQEFSKGLDRLTVGWGPQESISILYLSKDGLLNLALTLEGHQANSKIKRNFQYDNPDKIFQKGWDNLWGIKLSWLIQLFSKENPDLIIY